MKLRPSRAYESLEQVAGAWEVLTRITQESILLDPQERLGLVVMSPL